MGTIAQDLRYALRACRRSPGFTVVAVLSLAIGIGANTAIFSLVNAVLLTPLPYPDPSRLVIFMTTAPEGAYHGASEVKFNAWRSLTSTFDDIAAFGFTLVNIPAGDHFERLTVGEVSAGFFPLFGARAQAGRTFSAAEDTPGADKVAVISDAFWTRRYQRGHALGQTLRLNGQSYAIVGVLQPFDAAIITNLHDAGPEVYVPRQIDPASTALAGALAVGGRLRPSVSLGEARARVSAATADLRRRLPAAVRQGDSATVERYQTLLRRNDRGTLLVLSAAVALVLLIACANLANLLLARGAAQARDLAVRAALGATRRRIVQQLLTESLLLAAIGGAAGLFIGRTAIHAVVALTGPTITRIGLTNAGVPVDVRVLIYTSAVAVVSVLVFGLLPALIASRVDLGRRFKDAQSQGAGGRYGRRFGACLTAAELGIAVVLLITAALFVRTFANLGQVATGFDTHDVLMLTVTGDPQSRTTSDVARTIRDGRDRLRGIPGVIDAAASCCSPLDVGNGDVSLRYVIEGRALDGPYHGIASWRPVGAGYFETLQISLLRGRTFTDRDSLDGSRVLIVNQAMADKWWPHGGAIGARLSLGKDLGGIWAEPPREIVGIVANVRDVALDRDPQPANYVPIAQLTDGASAWMDEMRWLVRTAGPPEALRPRIERELQRAAGGMPVGTEGPLDTVIARSTARATFRMWLMGTFALIALLLAAIGVYGVMAYAVRQRTREIGIRIAIGAEPRDVTRMVVMSSLRYALAGIAGGVAAAAVTARLLRAFLFGVSPWDPAAAAAAILALVLVAGIAAWAPARRAARIDPLVALRAE
jgi:putative ABC transport system permease protein